MQTLYVDTFPRETDFLAVLLAPWFRLKPVNVKMQKKIIIMK